MIDNGDDSPGTMLERCSDELRRRFADADLVVSKGQGNLESLWGARQAGLFFLFKVKCAAVERNLGLDRGETVLLRNPPPA